MPSHVPRVLAEAQDKQEEPKKGEKEPPAPSEIKCIVMDGQALDIAQWQTLDKIPTKQELLTKIAVGIKANPTKIALSIKAVPRKLAFGAYSACHGRLSGVMSLLAANVTMGRENATRMVTSSYPCLAK